MKSKNPVNQEIQTQWLKVIQTIESSIEELKNAPQEYKSEVNEKLEVQLLDLYISLLNKDAEYAFYLVKQYCEHSTQPIPALDNFEFVVAIKTLQYYAQVNDFSKATKFLYECKALFTKDKFQRIVENGIKAVEYFLEEKESSVCNRVVLSLKDELKDASAFASKSIELVNSETKIAPNVQLFALSSNYVHRLEEYIKDCKFDEAKVLIQEFSTLVSKIQPQTEVNELKSEIQPLSDLVTNLEHVYLSLVSGFKPYESVLKEIPISKQDLLGHVQLHAEEQKIVLAGIEGIQQLFNNEQHDNKNPEHVKVLGGDNEDLI